MSQKLQSKTTVKLSNGQEIPIFGFGTYLAKGNDAYESTLFALKNGYIHVDTAQVYGNEEQVGQAIKDSGVDRSKIYVTTKLWWSNFSEKAALPSLEESLKKLQLDYVDLVLLHTPGIPSNTKDEQKENPKKRKEAWLALEQFHKDGKTKSIGISNFWPLHIDEILEYCTVKPHVNQIEYHPWNQRKVQVNHCIEKGIVVEGWGPLAKNQILEDETLKELAKKYKKTVAQICIRWCLQNNIITIPKSVKESRILENIDVFDFEIDETDMKTINEMDKGYLSAGKGWEHDQLN